MSWLFVIIIFFIAGILALIQSRENAAGKISWIVVSLALPIGMMGMSYLPDFSHDVASAYRIAGFGMLTVSALARLYRIKVEKNMKS